LYKINETYSSNFIIIIWCIRKVPLSNLSLPPIMKN
jgi:hypothetical protein